MKTLELKKDFYWTGILDKDLKVFDIIMETEFGTSYNSYILKTADKIVLFETAKEKFFDEYLEELKQITDIRDIDTIVVNHTEPDHAGSVGRLLDLNPEIKIVGTACAINFLKEIINRDFNSQVVKENDEIKVGDKTLRFMPLPNLHWPDTMYTYIVEDKTLVTCDSFGAHYAFDDILLSKLTDHEGYERALKYYFDNILGPFKPFMVKALNRIKDLDVDMICTGHGPVIDCRIDELSAQYYEWSKPLIANARKTVVMPYVSAYGYTKQVAEAIAQGLKSAGDLDVKMYDMVEADSNEVLMEIEKADGLLFGSPTILQDALKPIWDLTTSIHAPTHGGKLASAFGSYAWSGEAVGNLVERLKQLKMKVVEGYRVKLRPSEKELAGAIEFGHDFGCMLLNKPKKEKNSKPKLVKCLICGEVFEEGTEICPVCGVGKENFVPYEEEIIDFHRDSKELFLIIGNGAAGLNAASAIRERNQSAAVILLGDETSLPYNRPMLTKTLLSGFESAQLLMHDEAWYKEKNILNLTQLHAAEIKPEDKEVVLSNGDHLRYDKLILATGSECFIPPIEGAKQEGVLAIRRIEDVEKLNQLLPSVKQAVVIGGGVLGLEAAWELSRHASVSVLELAPQLMGRQLDMTASTMLEERINAAGIKTQTNVQIKAIEGDGRVSGVRLADGTFYPAELVIISCGIRANTALAIGAGIECGRAIKVNEHCQTSLSDIYAAGDCAEYQGINFGNWEQAVEMGKVAGACAAGDSISYSMISPGLSFQGMNTALYAYGDNGKQSNQTYRSVVIKEDEKHTLEICYFTKEQLCGFILLGDVSKMTALMEAVRDQKTFKELFG